jgi:ferrous-iron efflux pump FieF
MDESLDAEQVARIRAVIAERVPEARDVHDLRTRRAGPDVFVDLHVAFDRDMSFVRAHRLSEDVREAIRTAFPGAQVQVHADPHPLLPGDEGGGSVPN